MNTTKSPQTLEALERIDDIHRILASDQNALFSGKKMTGVGVFLLIAPLIEWSTHYFTFHNEFLMNSDLLIMAIHWIFYAGVSIALSRLLGRMEVSRENDRHPLIKKAFQLVRYYWTACLGVALAFSFAGHGEFIYPVIFILMGLLFGLYGRFSTPVISAVAWGFIAVGCGLIAAMKYALPDSMWIYCMIYQGLSFIVMGWSMSQERLKLEVAHP